MKPENSWMCWTIPARRGTQAKRINSRLSSGDLQAIRTRALQAGIPDQTLISSILNQFVNGDLQQRSAR
jgi:predicted DNA binding CopG/RHH family protein